LSERQLAVKRFRIDEAIDWNLGNVSLRQELVNEAGSDVIPTEFLDSWHGDVEIEGDEFVVTIWSGYP